MVTPRPVRSVEQIQAEGYELAVGDCLSEGFALFQKAMGPFVLWTLACWVASGLIGVVVPFVGGIAAAVLVVPIMSAGSYHAAFKLMRGETVEFNDFTKVFDRFGPLALTGLFVTLIVGVGSVLCVLPGIYAKLALVFVYPLILTRGIEPIEALKASFAVVNKNFVAVLLLGLMAFALSLAGAVACGVGLLFAYPIIMCMVAVAYNEVFGIGEGEGPAEVVQ